MRLILIILAGMAIYYLLKQSKSHSSQGSSNETNALRETALDILKKRFARCEITKEEFEHIKKDL